MNPVFNELSNLVTEKRNPKSTGLDEMNTLQILKLMNSEDKKVPEAIEKEIPYISQAVDIVSAAFRNGGRLIYVGAGTSGRLGVLDASECPPTFGVPNGVVVGLIAGGKRALYEAVEGFEDFEENGANDLRTINPTKADVVCGIAASKRTPYVLGALKEAKKCGAKTLAVVCNPREHLQFDVGVAICPVSGPEIVMGSTRLKAGSSQKMVLNMLTTAAFILNGKVYENMMIDLQQNNIKLVERSKRIIMLACEVDYLKATELLKDAKGHVKTAIFMGLTNKPFEIAENEIIASNGFLKTAIKTFKNKTL